MHSRYLYSNTPNVRGLPNALLVSIECRGEGIEVVVEFHQSKTPHMAKIQSSKDFFFSSKTTKAPILLLRPVLFELRSANGSLSPSPTTNKR